MRRPFLLALSLALNLVLALAWWRQTRAPQTSTTVTPPPVLVVTQHLVAPARVIGTNLIIHAPGFHWRQVESEDWFQYVANLRAIGCPESTIRDIIIADVNHHYAKKRAALVPTENDFWWRSDPDLDALSRSFLALEKLDLERRELLRQLLGPDWEKSEESARADRRLEELKFSGPVLSQLPATTISAIYDARELLQKQMTEHLRERAAAGLPPDPMLTAHFQRLYREKLEHLLTPEQLEEFLLRNSALAAQLRTLLQGFEASPEEFRSIFRALDAAQRQLMWATVSSPQAYEEQRLALQKQADAQLQRLLGKERYHEYQLNQDPLFRQTRTLAQTLEVPPEVVLPLYEIQKASAAEEAALRNNPDLSPDARTAALQTMREQREAAIRALLGNAVYERYAKSLESGRP